MTATTTPSLARTFGAQSTADDVLAGRDLTGRRFLITGAASGIGLETARALLAHGASVVGAVRGIAPGQPAWKQERQIRAELVANLARAQRLAPG